MVILYSECQYSNIIRHKYKRSSAHTVVDTTASSHFSGTLGVANSLENPVPN